MDKFQLYYRLEVQDMNGTVQIINFPLTLDFNTERNTMAGYNTAEFTVFNLAYNLRTLLRRNTTSFSDSRTIKFYAGYGANIILVFSGYVQTCRSTRPDVDWMTTFSCYDPGPQALNKNISPPPFSAGSSQAANVKFLVNQYMTGVEFGQIGAIFAEAPTLLRGNSYNGSVSEIIRKMTNGNFFIDNGKAYVLLQNECIQNEGLTTIDYTTGLLGVPPYEETFINPTILFEPTVIMSQQLTLKSQEKYLNGKYKVVAINHSGRVSGSQGSTVETSLSLYNPTNSQGQSVLTFLPGVS